MRRPKMIEFIYCILLLKIIFRPSDLIDFLNDLSTIDFSKFDSLFLLISAILTFKLFHEYIENLLLKQARQVTIPSVIFYLFAGISLSIILFFIVKLKLH